jgi:transposase-like protein
VREGGRVVSVAVIVAVAVTTEGRREIVGLHIGPSEAEIFWTDFLRDLVKRGDIAANVDMRPGDILIIPQSFF